MMEEKNKANWRVHTMNLFKEIVEETNSKDSEAITKPLQIMAGLLFEVGKRASELDDPRLNELMCRLTIYTIADPQNKDYDPVMLDKILKGGLK